MCSWRTWSRFVLASMAACIGLSVLVGGCSLTPIPSIMQVVQADESLSTLAGLLQEAGLDNTLRNSSGPYTLFAPMNAAFTSLPAATQDELLKGTNLPLLADMLRSHIVPGVYLAGQLRHNQVLTTLNNNSLTVRIDNGVIYVAGAPISEGDVSASNGVIHVMGGVIMAPAN